MELASAVLVNWKRPGNIPRIVESLRALEFVDDIVIWDNSASLRLPDISVWFAGHYHGTVRMGAKMPPIALGDEDDVSIVSSQMNRALWGRFLATDLVGHDLILTQDDDYEVNNWQQLYDTAMQHPDRIVGNMHLNEPNGGLIPCGDGFDIMLGWGSVFRRSWIEPAFQPYIDRYGVDDILRRDADRVFAVMQGMRHIAIQAQTTPLTDVDANWIAMHKEHGHKLVSKEARRRAAELLEQRTGDVIRTGY